MEHDVGGGDQERDPVLVEGEHHDRHEEEEVTLDRALPDVDEQRTRRHQAERDEHRGHAPARLEQQGGETDREQRDGVRDAVQQAASLRGAEETEADRLGEQQADHRVVAVQPRVIGQGAARWDQQTQP
jgi:hypothetical protein